MTPGWTRGPGGVLVAATAFVEPPEDELKAYDWTAVPVDERPRPTCGKPGTGRSAHQKHGEIVCNVCRLAENEYARARREGQPGSLATRWSA